MIKCLEKPLKKVVGVGARLRRIGLNENRNV